jgi:hypothetical protein
VIDIRIVESEEEAIGYFISALRILFVEDSLATLKLACCLLIERTFLRIFYVRQLLNGNGSKSFEDFLEMHLFVGLLMCFLLFELLP